MARIVQKPGRKGFFILWEGGKHPDTGKRIVRWTRAFPSLEEAQAALPKYETASESSAPAGSFAAFMTEWLKWKSGDLRPKTLEGYRSTLVRYALPHIGLLRLDSVTTWDLDQLYRAMGEAGLSPTTIRLTHRILRRLFEDALRWTERTGVRHNPADRAVPPRAQAYKALIWTPDQQAAFLRHVRGRDDEVLWRLLVLYGCRRGEALGVRWCDLDLGTRLWNVCNALVWTGKELVQGPPKSQAGERLVRLDARTAELLRKLSAGRAVVLLKEDTELVFGGVYWALDYRWEKLLEETGLPRIRIHDLRHSLVTLARLRAGASDKVIQEMVGHSDLTTSNRYTHAAYGESGDLHDQLVERVVGLLDS